MRASRCARNWAKQVAVWLAISVLVPLLGYYGTAAVYPPPDSYEYDRSVSELRQKREDTKDEAEQARLAKQIQDLQDQNHEAEKIFARKVFWVACPVGLLAFTIGILSRVQSVGAGLMFGGLSSLTEGCYSAWDLIGRWTQLSSLIICLAVIIVLGLWRFRPAPDELRLPGRPV